MPVTKYLLVALVAASVPVPVTAGNYTVDPEHTYPSLEFSHMGLSTWRGRFNKSSGKIALDRAARTGEVDILVDTTSIDFGHNKMKEFAFGVDWLNVDNFPTMTYRGKLNFKGDVPVYVDGTLTLRGITKPLKLKITNFKCMEHPMFKKEVCGADAEGDMNRADFGMTKYSEGEAGKIHLKIQVEAIQDGP